MKDKIILEILDKKRQSIFKELTALFQDKKYYLAGGTALALQIGHRESFDFDIFRNKEITFHSKNKILRYFSKNHLINTLVDTSDELSVVLDDEIKITVLNYFWDPIFPSIKSRDFIPLLSIKDIACTKAYALGRRGNYRDYFDLYIIIKDGYASIWEIIKWCKKKYGDIFSERMFLEQLTYLEDIEKNEHLKFLKEKYVSPKFLAKFFKKKLEISFLNQSPIATF